MRLAPTTEEVCEIPVSGHGKQALQRQYAASCRLHFGVCGIYSETPAIFSLWLYGVAIARR